MEPMRARKDPGRRRQIDALLQQTNRHENDMAAHILNCIVRGFYFDANALKETHPCALELAYLHPRRRLTYPVDHGG